MSQLDWSLDPLWYYGLKLSALSRGGFFVDASLRSGISGYTGNIEDSDFVNGDGVKTNLSVSENHTEAAFLADFAIGWRLPLAGPFSLKAFGGLDCMHFKFTARNGYYQYGNWNAKTGKYDPYSNGSVESLCGTGIVLEQDFLAPSMGASLDYRPDSRFSASLSVLFSPWASCTVLDNHMERFIDFTSSLAGGCLLEPKLAAEYAISKAESLSLSVAYRSVWGLKGDEKLTVTSGADSYYVYYHGAYVPYTTYLGLASGSSHSYVDGEGGAFEALDLGLTLKVLL